MSAIEFKQVEKSFKDGDTQIEALKETNFSVEKGEFIAIIGPSGSGKSTFLTIAGGLQAPSKGQVLINNESFSDQKEKQRAQTRFKEIGFILQASNLVPFLTVKKQLQLVNKVSKNTQTQSSDALFAQLGIADLVNKYPEELSGGERQRVAIARALYHDPTIILADEPTASLDSKKAIEVVEILAKETKEKEKATIMVTHDTRLIDYCDRVLVMEDGVLTEQTHQKKAVDSKNQSKEFE
ncbi:ABC transporter ATP-binding protein [Enterococcus sp. RIT-PI-f]|uniref:ABC transporter ATP-binding protein n=1 Tax=Enterococcus sp. RIT-PI-f TaxID=1690244 RepID=UPI0006B9CDC7|nr:ABC transporter ATP-binding protein [Enterococcus sp. RIT-PI-f]KPG73044.1 hemin ABC transporter ATP-binding protein [Enterococcus sp. RIT-PI-f]